MVLCASCQSKTSTKQCPNQALRDIIFCGKHVKVKSPRLWSEINDVPSKAILIQRIWRGYFIRRWMRLAGPGVLKRSVCHNEEEVVTFDDKKSVSPLDYFSFEEAGKVYWFDIRSIFETMISNLNPTNPYTREPLSTDTRVRLRVLSAIRTRANRDMIHDMKKTVTFGKALENKWTSVCQILEENGFSDVLPNYFLMLSEIQLYAFALMLTQDITAWAAQHTSPTSRRKVYLRWVKRLSGEYLAGIDGYDLSYTTATTVYAMISNLHEPYELCFMVVSALYRL